MFWPGGGHCAAALTGAGGGAGGVSSMSSASPRFSPAMAPSRPGPVMKSDEGEMNDTSLPSSSGSDMSIGAEGAAATGLVSGQAGVATTGGAGGFGG